MTKVMEETKKELVIEKKRVDDIRELVCSVRT